jgi:hypothetical protein
MWLPYGNKKFMLSLSKDLKICLAVIMIITYKAKASKIKMIFQ